MWTEASGNDEEQTIYSFQCLIVSSHGGSTIEQKIKDTAAMVTGSA